MGIKNSTDDVARLSQEVNRVRHCIDEVMADLAKVKERIPGPREIISQFSPASEEHRRHLFYSCTSLELALQDTRRWVHDLADKGPTLTMAGLFIETLTWPEVESALSIYDTVLVPLGAQCKEHGRHLPLNTDWVFADYLTRRVVEVCRVIALPTIGYGYYPAFTEYPGSVNIGAEPFRDLVCDICRSFARHGLSKFYVLNTGISTIEPLAAAPDLGDRRAADRILRPAGDRGRRPKVGRAAVSRDARRRDRNIEHALRRAAGGSDGPGNARVSTRPTRRADAKPRFA